MRVREFVRLHLVGPFVPTPLSEYYRHMLWMATGAVWLTTGMVAALELLDGDQQPRHNIILALFAGAAIITVIAYSIPWKTLIGRFGINPVFYIWSFILVAFGSMAVYTYPHINSDLHLLYFPVILFVVTTLDGRSQAIMVGVGMVSYSMAVMLSAGPSIRDLVLRLLALGLVAMLGSYITREQRETARENAGLYEETRRASEELRHVFNRFGKALASSLDLDKTLQLITDLAVEMVGTDAALLVLLDNQGNIIDPHAGSGERQAALRRVHDVAHDWLISGIVRGRSAVQIPDLTAEARLPAGEKVDDLRSYLGVPLLLRGRVVGLLAVGRARPGYYEAGELELLSSFANQAAVAIENARLFTSLQERLRELSGLHNISLAFASLTTLEATFGQLVERIARLLDMERCVILLIDEEHRSLVAQEPAFGLPAEKVRTLNIPIDERSAAARVWLTGRPYLTNDAQSDPRNIHRFARDFGDRSLVIVPMRVEGKTVGLLRASNKRHDRFTNNDLRLLTIFANQAAVVVRNAMLYREVAYQRARLEAIFDNASDGIMIIDKNSTIVAFNHAMERLSGWEASEAIGRSCDEVCQTVDQAACGFCQLVCPKPYVFQQGQGGRYVETRITTKDERHRDVGVSYSLLLSPEGETYGVAIVRDISEAKELDRVKSQFISTVSHELRTPLASIKASIGLLLANAPDTTPEPLVRLMHNIDRSGRRLESLVADLLDLARLESGRVLLLPRRIDLREVVNAAANTIRPLTQEKGQQLALELPEEPCYATADRQRLEQALLNLLSNANKYTPGGGHIVVAIAPCTPAPDDGDRMIGWCVSVKDDGPGIPPEDREHVFERFYRVGDEETQRSIGTGLGLPIAKALIELHGGHIWLESQPGRGSTFYFSLPKEGVGEDSCR